MGQIKRKLKRIKNQALNFANIFTKYFTDLYFSRQCGRWKKSENRSIILATWTKVYGLLFWVHPV